MFQPKQPSSKKTNSQEQGSSNEFTYKPKLQLRVGQG